MFKPTNMLGAIKRTLPFKQLMSRCFKNFGHKRQPTPNVTMLWHGFLTFTFIGMAIEWKRVAYFFLGDAAFEEGGEFVKIEEITPPAKS